ncbi:MAG: helix-turn-helix domain-containing protein [Clostridia bacterium]|nr:helix-turn-helix domain-containing protein [Clostridia bacterium]
MYNLKSYKFGENFRRIRKLKKISVSDIAKQINKTDTTVYKYERGELIPDIETVLQICNALEINFDDLTKIKNIEDTEKYSKNPFDANTMYLYYLGFKKLMLFKLEFRQEAGFEVVTFNDIKTNAIFFEGTIESNQERAYIVMKNFFATNTKFEKVQLIINLTYTADGNYVGVITGTEDRANMPMMKRCILTKEMINENNQEEIQKIKDRLKISKEELEHLTEENFLTLDISNETNYKVI